MNQGKHLLVLGSGFSHSIFPQMPTVSGGIVGKHLKKEIEDLKQDPYERLADDPELLLSYLGSNQPWKKPAEKSRDESLFYRVQQALADFIAYCEEQAFSSRTPPDWAIRLVNHLHRTKTTVITFNYDTVLERIACKIARENSGSGLPSHYSLTFSVYDLPLSPLGLREAGTSGIEEVDTFRLIKLHGSINWFYSGPEGSPGEQVYLRLIDSDSPKDDLIIDGLTSEREIRRLKKDKVPLIIPPVAEKSLFYANRTIHTIWRDAQEALKEAAEILCAGYSLPPTDLSTKLLFQSVAHPKKVLIFNREEKDYKDRYRQAFPGADICLCCGSGSVESMVEYLTA